MWGPLPGAPGRCGWDRAPGAARHQSPAGPQGPGPSCAAALPRAGPPRVAAAGHVWLLQFPLKYVKTKKKVHPLGGAGLVAGSGAERHVASTQGCGHSTSHSHTGDGGGLAGRPRCARGCKETPSSPAASESAAGNRGTRRAAPGHCHLSLSRRTSLRRGSSLGSHVSAETGVGFVAVGGLQRRLCASGAGMWDVRGGGHD